MGVTSISNLANPLQVSDVNPRYLTDGNGKAIVFSGFHTWYNIQDGGNTDPPPTFDWTEYINALVSYGCNFTKLWANETAHGWGGDFPDEWMTPTRYDRTGPGNDNASKLRFDLDAINQTYLTRLRDRAVECGANGIYVAVQLFQGWQIENKGATGDPFVYHPYELANNINSVDGDQDNDTEGLETHYQGAQNVVLSYQQAMVDAIIDKINDLDNVIFEISNEDTGSASNTNWQTDMIDYIRTYEASKPKQHLVGMTVQWPSGDNSVLDTSGADWVSYNSGKADAVHAASDPVSMYDSDHTVGITTDYSFVWEAFCNGHGGSWFMDKWYPNMYGEDKRNSAAEILIRENLGYLNTLASDLLADLLGMTPQPSLCATNFCIAKDQASNAEYVCYQPNSGAFNLDLTNASGTLNIRWLRCSDGTVDDTDTVSGGSNQTLTPPWSGRVVAYVRH